MAYYGKRTEKRDQGVRLKVFGPVLMTMSLLISTNGANGSLSSNESEDNVCMTPSCIETSQEVLKNMDLSADPCDDFYKFSCGGFMNKTEIPSAKLQVSATTITSDIMKEQIKLVLEKPLNPNESRPFGLIKKLYRMCMNTSTFESNDFGTVKEIFKDVGDWPILEGERWNETEFSWTKSMQNFRKLGLKMDGLFAIQVATNITNSTRRMLKVDWPKINITRENFTRGFVDSMVQEYYDYLLDLSLHLDVDPVFAASEARSVIEFTIEISNFTDSPTLPYNPMTIKEMQNSFPGIDWLDLINGIVSCDNINITNNEVIHVPSPQYIKKLISLLNRTPKRVQANYMFFQAAVPIAQQIPKNYSDCIFNTAKALHLGASALFIRNYFNDDVRQEALHMLKNIKNAFLQIIKKLDWMDEATKKSTIEKALSITDDVGYANELLDNKKLEEYYSKLNFTSDTYLRALNEINFFKTDIEFSQLRMPVNKTDWTQSMATFIVNAQYAHYLNRIRIPAAILQGNLFNKSRPYYMKYGGISWIMGHEVTHGFNGWGMYVDKEGNYKFWLSDKSYKALQPKLICFMNQYSGITVPELGVHLNGRKTLYENIADNGGLTLSYLAYNNWIQTNGTELILPGLNFTTKQLFWISIAHNRCAKLLPASLQYQISNNVHSPNNYRVVIPFSNNDYFAKDFNCPVGSKMNLKQKCKLWE